MNIQKILDYWLKGADRDFDLAQKLFQIQTYHYTLFFCHLALEKLLKAIFVERKKTHAPYTHALLVLAEKAGLELNQTQKDFLDEMTKFNIEGRYPEEIDELDKKFTLEYTKPYFDKTHEFFLWLKTIR